MNAIDSILKQRISSLLLNILPKKDIHKYVTDTNMIIWQEAFTSETYNPTYNYEKREYIGDRVLKVVFAIYLMIRFPNYTPMEISNIDMLMMEKKTQYDLSVELNFIELIKLPKHESVPVGVGGDVYESFFGALDEVSDSILPGLGLINSYNMIVYIFNKRTIADELRKGSIKMVVEQIFIQLGLKINHHIEQEKNKYIASINLNEEQLQFFESHGKHLPLTIGKGIAMSNKPALKIAYDQAKLTLEKYNINAEFIEQIKLERKKEVSEKVMIEKEIKVLDISVKDLVLQLLKPVIKQEIIMKFVDDKYMNTWYKIFDDEKSTLNQHKYEKLYFIGEIIIKGLLAKQLNILYTDYDKEDFNNILSNIVQNYNIFLQDKPLSYLIDNHTFEAFMGAVETISDELLKGSGLINCNQLVKHIFKLELIPYEYRYTHPKTVFEQLFAPFFGQKNSKPLVEYEYDTEYHYKISLTDEQFKFLHQYKFNIKNKLLAEVSGKFKIQTQKEAYAQALVTLEKYNINKKELNLIKNKLDFNHPKLIIYNKLLDKKYDYFYFASPSKTKTLKEFTIQLVGVKDNHKTILSSLVVDTGYDIIDAKVELVKLYLHI